MPQCARRPPRSQHAFARVSRPRAPADSPRQASYVPPRPEIAVITPTTRSLILIIYVQCVLQGARAGRQARPPWRPHTQHAAGPTGLPQLLGPVLPQTNFSPFFQKWTCPCYKPRPFFFFFFFRRQIRKNQIKKFRATKLGERASERACGGGGGNRDGGSLQLHGCCTGVRRPCLALWLLTVQVCIDNNFDG